MIAGLIETLMWWEKVPDTPNARVIMKVGRSRSTKSAILSGGLPQKAILLPRSKNTCRSARPAVPRPDDSRFHTSGSQLSPRHALSGIFFRGENSLAAHAVAFCGTTQTTSTVSIAARRRRGRRGSYLGRCRENPIIAFSAQTDRAERSTSFARLVRHKHPTRDRSKQEIGRYPE
jgi:hypothetical protein